MKYKILSIVTMVTMLFNITGCGEDSSSSTSSVKNETEVSVTFQNTQGKRYEKLSDIDHITLSIFDKNANESTKEMTKSNGVYTASLTLDTLLNPYTIKASAYNSNSEVIYYGEYRGNVGEGNITIVLIAGNENDFTSNGEGGEVVNDTSSLPSVSDLAFLNGQLDLSVLNLTNDETWNYVISCNNGVTFNPSSGTIPPLDISSQVIRPNPMTEDASCTITITNANGDRVIVPFSVSANENTNQVVNVNLPPDVEISITPNNPYTVTASVTNLTVQTYSYEWQVFGGTIPDPSISSSVVITETSAIADLSFILTVTDVNSGAKTVLERFIRKGQTAQNKLKKTGQTKSYDKDGTEVTDGSLKDDGFYKSGIEPSYTRDDTTNTVTDNVTGLVWQDDDEAKTIEIDWEAAKSYCESKSTPLGIGWRLPTRKELQGLADYGNGNLVAISSSFQRISTRFPYWTGTSSSERPSVDAWTVYFKVGNQKTIRKTSENYHVRCVR